MHLRLFSGAPSKRPASSRWASMQRSLSRRRLGPSAGDRHRLRQVSSNLQSRRSHRPRALPHLGPGRCRRPRLAQRQQHYKLLRNPGNLSANGHRALDTLLNAKRELSVTYLLKDAFHQVWIYTYRKCADRPARRGDVRGPERRHRRHGAQHHSPPRWLCAPAMRRGGWRQVCRRSGATRWAAWRGLRGRASCCGRGRCDRRSACGRLRFPRRNVSRLPAAT